MNSVYRPARDVEAQQAANRVERDLGTRTGAEMLARELDQWWHSRGFPQVKHWVELTHVAKQRQLRSDTIGPDHPVWCVRSNLVNGLPPPKGG